MLAFASWRSGCGHLPRRLSQADEAFLCHGGYQLPRLAEDQAAGKAPPAAQVGAVLRIEQPFVGAERPMNPQRVIETRGHNLLLEYRVAMRHQGGVEQGHVARISQYAAVDRGIVRQLPGSADPDIEARIIKFLSEVALP